MTIENIPLEIRPYILEISERLWTGHASVMVGAGFSKNAISKDRNKNGLPNWHDLGNIFFEKIHGRLPNRNANFLNPLKLADEVQAAFGRSVLDQLLKKHIRDNDFEPSPLHVKLLDLPWSDVFTTNYDTLLERSCENVISRRYDIVINQEDIIYSKRPRIVKLHGSFPSERPLIITEEDYRTYPHKFAPFVNTVQQSLLENTLCLIGFSGDDPNFLQWIGWINDNIGKENSPKIYLVGILNISNAQKKLLENKNIVPVDLSMISSVRRDHSKAIGDFLSLLYAQRKKSERLDWPLNQKFFNPSSISIEDLVSDWRQIRQSYPNWIILPQRQREKLWDITELIFRKMPSINDLKPIEDLEFAFELNWRLERCLIPIFNDLTPLFESILDRYNLFPSELGKQRIVNFGDESIGNVDWTELRVKWVTIAMSLLRFYREENVREKWNELNEELFNIVTYLTPEQQASLYYERIMQAFFDADIEAATKIANEWPINYSIPLWEAKRASVLAEIGQVEEAEKALEISLNIIRKRLNLSPIEQDYYWVSQEAYVMYLLKIIDQNNNEKREFLTSIEKSQEFYERWNTLLQYKCDPWGESRFFELSLPEEYTPRHYRKSIDEFEIGRTTVTYSYGRNHKEVFTAYTFLRYLEEIGLPVSLQNNDIESKTINGALVRVMPFSPSWGLSVLSRCSDIKSSNFVFDRKFFRTIVIDQVENHISYYLKKFDRLYPLIEDHFYARAFVKKVPSILSRLCIKCKDASKLEMFRFYQRMFSSNIKLEETDRLLKNLVSSTKVFTLAKAIPILLETPILNTASSHPLFIEPFDILPMDNRFKRQLKIDGSIVRKLLAYLKNDDESRVRASKRLFFLYRNDCLNKNQTKQFFQSLWLTVNDATGFPDKINVYNFRFLSWPNPKGLPVVQLFKDYIFKNNFRIQALQDSPGVSMTGGSDQYTEELLYGSANIYGEDGIDWTRQELDHIFKKCETWWNADKHFLSDEKYKAKHFGGSSIYDEFQSRFKNLIAIFATVFGYQRKTINDKNTLKKIREILLDAQSHSVPILKAKVVFGDLMYSSPDEYLVDLEKALISDVEIQIIDGLQSAAYCIFTESFNANSEVYRKTLNLVLEPIKWRKSDMIPECLDVIASILLKVPMASKLIEADLINIFENLFVPLNQPIEEHGEKKEELDQLLIKKKVLSLASILYNLKRSTGQQIPQQILSWKKIAEDINEPGDVTIAWRES